MLSRHSQTRTEQVNRIKHIFIQLKNQLLHRHGVHGVLLLWRALQCRDDSAGSEIDHARAALASLSVRMTDEDFLLIKDNVSSQARFYKMIGGEMSDRRKTVLDLAWTRLASIYAYRHAADGSMNSALPTSLPASVLSDHFDVRRHKEVQDGTVTAEEAIEEFMGLLRREVHVESTLCSHVFYNEYLAYFCGLSNRIPKDVDFELYIVRSWNLDAPPNGAYRSRQEQEAAFVDMPMSTLGREHPLYQTSSSVIGAPKVTAFPVETCFRRAGKFTQREPPREPAATLNTSIAKSRIM